MKTLTILLTLAIAAPAVSQDSIDGVWKAGAASIVITPEMPMWMSGYASRTKPAEGKLQDLKAKALVLEDAAGTRTAIVTIDLVGIPRNFSQAVCRGIENEHKLGREAVMLSVSHTHSGPVIGMNLRPTYTLTKEHVDQIKSYTAALQTKLVDLVGKAIADLQPAELSWGRGYTTFAVNRRNNAENDVPTLREQGKLVGPVDHDVPVLAIRDRDGALRAVLFGYACHATVLSGYEWSGDYPGVAQAAIEEAHPGVTALFFAGCGADQNPVPRRDTPLATEYGNRLAAAVEEVIDAPMRPIGGSLAAAYTEIPLEFAGLPSREQIEAAAESSNRYEAARARLLLEKIEKDGSLRSDYPYPIQAWRLGDGPLLVALGGEVVVDYSLRLKAELGRETTWVAGYTNDVMAYIPSLRVLNEGGYEGGGAMVYYGLPAPWSPRVEEAVVAGVHQQVAKVRGDPASR